MREQISSEMWEHLNELYLFIRSNDARELFHSSPYQFYKRILEGSFQFLGITDATMTHGEGWDFIQLGKFLERADRTSRILDVKYHILLPSGERVGGNVDTVQWMAVLRSCSALEAYTKLYVGQIAPWKVAEFLILHDCFPRALRHCIHQVDYALHRISGVPEDRFANEAERLSGKLRSDLDYMRIGEIFQTGLHQYLDRLQLRITQISNAVGEIYCEIIETPAQSQSQSQSQTGGGGSQSQSQSQTACLSLTCNESVTRQELAPRGRLHAKSAADGRRHPLSHRLDFRPSPRHARLQRRGRAALSCVKPRSKPSTSSATSSTSGACAAAATGRRGTTTWSRKFCAKAARVPGSFTSPATTTS